MDNNEILRSYYEHHRPYYDRLVEYALGAGNGASAELCATPTGGTDDGRVRAGMYVPPMATATGRVLTDRQLNRAVTGSPVAAEAGAPAVAPRARRNGRVAGPVRPFDVHRTVVARVDGFERASLTAALENRTVIQGTLMRATIHLVSAADYWPWRNRGQGRPAVVVVDGAAGPGRRPRVGGGGPPVGTAGLAEGSDAPQGHRGRGRARAGRRGRLLAGPGAGTTVGYLGASPGGLLRPGIVVVTGGRPARPPTPQVATARPPTRSRRRVCHRAPGAALPGGIRPGDGQ